ncbi:glycosyltransferase family 32 protein [Stipitochalara longipes BDJ]|nr:glycosyltransferase family 32 protein [Stipitochalara longipes BDJ]
MISYSLPASKRRRQPLVFALLLLIALWTWHSTRTSKAAHDEGFYPERYPLAWKHVSLASTPSGAWYIPPEWLEPSEEAPRNIFEAAQLAQRLAVKGNRNIPYSKVPLIIHQTWKDTNLVTWKPDILEGVERWLTYATATGNQSMAYFLWLDDGCKDLISGMQPDLVDYVDVMPLMVEKSDVFRVLVVNLIGGVYGDVDTLPLRSPASWLDHTDVSPWTDPETGKTFSSPSKPIELILGIEGDNRPDTDDYWRMGYNYPVQLTQWALASAPNHPILNSFVSNFVTMVQEVTRPYRGDAKATKEALYRVDPIELTGPAAVTLATMRYLEEKDGLRWDALTGLVDQGRSKAVGNTLIYPITAFSPGRGKWHGMGSKPITDPDARVLHRAQGSWKTPNLKVEFGKFCRTVFGGCRDWSRVP